MTEAKPKKPTPKKAAPKKPALVKMVNIEGKAADVHPSEVDNYIKGNYRKL